MKRLLHIVLTAFALLLTHAVKAQCSAQFTTNAPRCFKDSVAFTYTGGSAVQAFSWNFDDPFSGASNTDTSRNPKHYFSQAGTLMVKLIITDTGSCRDTVTLAVKILQLPKAIISVSNPCLQAGTQLISGSTHDAADSIISYAWQFGDGGTGNIKNPFHNYSGTGTKSVKLSIVTANGCTDSTTGSIVIFDKLMLGKDLDSVCSGNLVNFSLQTGTSNPTQWNWDFGDASSSNISAPAHQYNGSGYYYPKVTVTYSNGSKCLAGPDSVFVLTAPNAEFVTASDTALCFKGNLACVKLKYPNQAISLRSVIFDDGYVDNTTPLTDSIICHHYVDVGGSQYSVAVSLVDINGCASTYTDTNTFRVYPEIVAGFNNLAAIGCFGTPVNITNTSNFTPPYIAKFLWDFGDGIQDSVNWSGLNHTYQLDGQFNITLMIEDQFGCRDTIKGNNQINNTAYIVDARIDSIYDQCYSANLFHFTQTAINGATIDWFFGDGNFSNAWSALYRYPSPGIYQPSVTIRKNGCDSTRILSQAEVLGPRAIIGAVTNRYQCQIKDTITFTNSTILHGNGPVNVYWDAGDGFANPCIYNTRDSQNLGMNCRYSTDSFIFRHMYQPGQEGCYYTKLAVYDTTTGCSDSIITSLPLMRPDASTGISFAASQFCIGPEISKRISVNIGGTTPSCDREASWVMWDSTCAAQSGNFNSHWVSTFPSHNYGYDNQPCDSNGYVTIGIVIQNGRDSAGNVCVDTAFYHHILKFGLIEPRFTSDYDPASHYCVNSSFTFTPRDTIQDSLTSVTWDWGDGTSDITTDTKPRTHTYTTAGSFRVVLTLIHKNGCPAIDSMRVNVGVIATASIVKNDICLGEPAQMNSFVRYWGDPVDYWNVGGRPESLSWDFGDGNGFSGSGTSPVVQYSRIGNYTVRMAVTDANNCHDTITLPVSMRVFSIWSDFSTAEDTFICDQLVSFQSVATTYDSVNMFGHIDDQVASYAWTFKPGNSTSIFQNPSKFLKAGNHNISLIATNTHGCMDTVTKDIVVIGPVPGFEFLTDSSGCEPHTLTFKNTSLNANSYTWYFRDSTNNVFSTTQDSNVTFTYNRYGVFYPQITAQGRYIVNGFPITCQATFPDSAIAGFREVTVHETPSPAFTHTTNCSNNTTSFTNTSKINTGSINSYYWDFGDGDTSVLADPQHQYADTGRYTVILRAYSAMGCSDTFMRQIIISPTPRAWFRYSDVCLGEQMQFFDSSVAYNDVIYKWNWRFGDGATSTAKNPVRLYTTDSAYTVSLVINNIAGCSDSVNRTVYVHSIPKASFNDTNACFGTPLQMQSTSTSKDMPLQYLWRPGNNKTDTSASIAVLYGAAGNYMPRLTVTTPYGCKDSVQQAVSVYHKPIAAFTVNDSDQCFRGHLFSFTDQSSTDTGSLTYVWDFGPGSSFLSNPSHSYTQHGSYTTQLIVSTANGCRDTSFKNLKVYPNPAAAYVVNNSAQCLNTNAFVFTDLSTIASGGYTRQWSTGDNTTYSDSVVLHHYADSGNFAVRLVVLSDKGCTDTGRSTVRVNPSPQASFTINDSTQCLRGNNFIFTNFSATPYGSTTAKWDFGDGSTSTSFNAAHTYNTHGTYTVTLITENNTQCSDTITQRVTVYPMPQPAFTIDDSLQCLRNNQFIVDNNSSIPAGSITHLWLFGDGATALQKRAGHMYATHGNYTITLRVTSAYGCVDSLQKPVEVYPMPLARFSINQAAQCFRGHHFVFNDTSSIAYGTYTRIWRLGDSTSSSANPISKTYARYGTYDIWLVLTSDKGCKDSMSNQARVFPQPRAAFSIDDSLQCLRGNLFSFTNRSTVSTSTLEHTWYFGDGSGSPQTNPSHSYSAYGNYTVMLKSVSPFGCADTAYAPLEVHAMPVTAFSINDMGQCVNNNNFICNDLSSIGSGTYTRLWDFGDSTASVSNPAAKVYNKHGSFVVKLVLTSNHGCKDSLSKTISIFPKPNPDFVIDKPVQCEEGNNFSFTNTSTLAYGTYSSYWRFGDNQSAAAYNTSHTYDTFGSYTVTLLNVSDSGCTDSVQKIIRVDPMPLPLMSVNKDAQCLNDQLFIFSDNSTIGLGSYNRLWTLGEQDSSVLQSPSKTFGTHGTYTIWLKLLSDMGCRDSIQQQVTVHPRPYASYTVNDSTQCINPNLFLLTSTSTLAYGSLQWKWRLGNGDTDTFQNIAYSYPTHGQYKVKLDIVSDKGCVDSADKPVEVYPKPVTSISANDSTQCENTNMVILKGDTSIPYNTIVKLFWNIGGSYIQGSADTFHHYPVYGAYAVYFSAESEFGCRDTSQLDLTIHPKPRASFTINDTAQCVNDNLFAFSNTSNIPYGSVSWLWDFGDGNSDTSFSPQHTYTQHDSLFVTLTAHSNNGCEDTVSHPVIIFPKPNVSFTVNDSTQCINGNYFTFTNSSNIAYGNLSYLWQLGNGQKATTTDTAYEYPLHGKYTVTLHALSSEGCRDSAKHLAITYPKPTPAFSINDTGQCLNSQQFVFTNLSSIDYGTNTYLWRFGDNSTDTTAHPVHTYNAFGDYTVELVTASDYTCRDSVRIPVRVFAKPFPSFTVNDTDQCINIQYFSFASTSTVPAGNIISKAWYFSDGGTGSGNNISHYFGKPGYYSAMLVTETDSGCIDSIRKTLRVYPKPIASFTINDSAQCLRGNSYIFTQTAFDSSGIKTYWWDIAGDKTASTPVVNHSFTDTGNKTIELRVTSNNGCGDTVKRKVFVKPMPDPGFAAMRNYYCQSDSSFPLLPNTAGGKFYGKNTLGLNYLPSLLWRDTVKYVVTVNGCTDSSVQYTNVYPPPKVNLGNDTLLCLYEIIQADVSFWNSTYKWSTGGTEPGYRFDKPGTYWIKVTNICGEDTDTITISYRDYNCHFYMPNAFSPNGDGHNDFFKPQLYDVENMQMEIYNRWGEKLYEGDMTSPGWDGNYMGQAAQQDVYMWIVNYSFPVGNKRIILHEAGTLTLVR